MPPVPLQGPLLPVGGTFIGTPNPFGTSTYFLPKDQTLLCNPIFDADSICNTECFPPPCIASPRLFTEKCIDFRLALEQKLKQNVNLPLFISFCFQIPQGQKNPKSKLKNLLFYSVKGQLCINMLLMQTDPNASIFSFFLILNHRQEATPPVSVALRNRANAKPLINHFPLKKIFLTIQFTI